MRAYFQKRFRGRIVRPGLVGETEMKLTIFSRVMIAQSAMILLVMVVSVYALGKLRLVSHLNSDALTVDAACVNAEKKLLKSFLAEMRNGEKYSLLHDSSFREEYVKNRADFLDSLSKLEFALDSKREKTLLGEIGALHTQYERDLLAASSLAEGDNHKSNASESIIERVNELIRIRELAISEKTALARDHADSAAEFMLWVTTIGIAGALALAYMHARGISRPLKRLAQEMQHIGRGEFSRSVHIKGPAEVQELTVSFNRMSEELEHLDRLKADFTAHVSHELRTPLTAIREGTAILLEGIPGPLTASQQEILEVVRNHSQRLFQCISSILDLSKMESEMMDYDFTMCDLNGLVANCVKAVELIARKREIRLQTNMDEKLPMLFADERRIAQVMDNLLSNALKFSPDGGEVLVDVHLASNEGREAREVWIKVSDNGPGIPKEELQNIFKQFYQSRKHKVKGLQGTGLGLAIARHIVEAHKGSIWAESDTGKGCVFCFTLPICPGTSRGGRFADTSESDCHV